MMRAVCGVCSGVLLAGGVGVAELSMPTVFSDHMVLQCGQEVPVWGTAEAGRTVTVEVTPSAGSGLAGQKKTVVADVSNHWKINLDPMPASSNPWKLHVSSSGFQVTFSDVLVGEVWLCSGQSNMELKMEGEPPKWPIENSAAEIAAADYPMIRFYRTPEVCSAKPLERIDGTWEVCSPETVGEFSATAYYFGCELLANLDVPIGLLECAWGGTQIEPWIPPCGFDGIDSLADIRRQIQDIDPNLGKDPSTVHDERQTPTVIYNAMLAAHIPFAIRGAVWYQGEANRHDGMLYVDKTRALLAGWRKLWGTDFPFYFVQIAPYRYGDESPDILPEFWSAQSQIPRQIPGTAMTVISDAGTADNIHPPNKKVPGKRLALLALDHTYGKDLVSSGPVFETMSLQEHEVVVTFSSAEGMTSRSGNDSPEGFELAGADGVFKAADAVIEGNRVVVSSGDVPEPQAVRFAWHKLAVPDLVNSAGLLASAFRAGELPTP